MIRRQPKTSATKRDYDRRKKRVNTRKAGKPFWRQPVLLGFVILLVGCGGAGGWWAWREGWLMQAQGHLEGTWRNIAGAITPFKLADVTVEGREYVERYAVLEALHVQRGDSLLGIDFILSQNSPNLRFSFFILYFYGSPKTHHIPRKCAGVNHFKSIQAVL